MWPWEKVSDLTQILEAGTLLIVERGTYSDYQFDGPLEMLVSASKKEIADAFREYIISIDDGHYEDMAAHFVPWLIETGRAKPVNANSWHIGGYNFEP